MANRYWVGGTANWDGTAGTKWATTSGGAGGASVPTPTDDVFFDANSGSGTVTVNTGNTGAKSITCTGFTGTFAGIQSINISGSLTLSSSMTYTYTGVMTFEASGTITSFGKTFGDVTVNGSGITVILADTLNVGPAKTFTLYQGTIDLNGNLLRTGIFASNSSLSRSISFGASAIHLTSTGASVTILNITNSTNFTWTGTGGFYRAMLSTATVAFTGTAANAPNLWVYSNSSTLTISFGSSFKNVDFTGSSCTVSGSYNAFGNLTLAAGGTYTGLLPTFNGSGTITSNGKTLGSVTVYGSGITVALNDNLNLGSSSLTLQQGTFNASNFDVSVWAFSSNISNTRVLNMGSGTWTISTSGSFAWNTANTTGMTLNPGTSTILMTSSFAKTFAGGGLTFYNLVQSGAGALTISGSNTFNNITNNTQPATITFTAGTTQTVSNFGMSGTAGSLITINSSSAGSQFTLSKASGVVDAQYLSIQDSTATGGATWNALVTSGNVDGGNNVGWNLYSSGTSALLEFF